MTELRERVQARMPMVSECTVLAPGPAASEKALQQHCTSLQGLEAWPDPNQAPVNSGSCIERELPPSPPLGSTEDSKPPKSCWSLGAGRVCVTTLQALLLSQLPSKQQPEHFGKLKRWLNLLEMALGCTEARLEAQLCLLRAFTLILLVILNYIES